MRFLEIDGGQAELREGPEPRTPPGWERVRVLACGICGTDVHLLHGMVLPSGVTYPIRPGHEVAGIVEHVADDGDVGAPGAGDLVVLHPLATCGRCAACRRGDDQLCEEARVLGIHDAGGLADTIVWPASRMLPANGIPPAQAAVLADAAATAYHAVQVARVPAGGTLCVLGAGGVGTQVLEIARALDPEIRLAAVVRSEATAARVAQLASVEVIRGLDGATRALRGTLGACDAVVDFTGRPEAPAEGARMLRRGGRLVIGSVVDERLDLGPSSTVLTRELQVVGAYASSLSDLAAVIELVQSGRLDVTASVSHRRPLSDAVRALDIVDERPPGLVRMVVERD